MVARLASSDRAAGTTIDSNSYCGGDGLETGSSATACIEVEHAATSSDHPKPRAFMPCILCCRDHAQIPARLVTRICGEYIAATTATLRGPGKTRESPA